MSLFEDILENNLFEDIFLKIIVNIYRTLMAKSTSGNVNETNLALVFFSLRFTRFLLCLGLPDSICASPGDT